MDKQKIMFYLGLCKSLNDCVFNVTHYIEFDSLSRYDARDLFYQLGSLSCLLSSCLMDLEKLLDYEKDSSQI